MNAVAVISKVPRPGRSKTRLARTLGDEVAQALHHAFLADEWEQLQGPWSLWWIHDGTDDEAAHTFGGHRLAPGAPDLAHELLRSFRTLLVDHDRVVIVSGDVPQIRATDVADALAALDDADLVLGPGPDGGYYLVGMKAPHDVFTPVAMSTAAVFQATVALAARVGIRVARMPVVTDIDEAQDLLALEAAPQGVARRTRAVVDGLVRSELALRLPTELQLEVTSRCNLRCPGCIRTPALPAPDADLTIDDFHRITADLPVLNRVAFQLNGEPLLARDLVPMVAAATARGAETVVNTNGLLLDRARAQALYAAGLGELRISLDGARPETVRQMAGMDAFQRVLKGVRAAVAARGDARTRISLWQVATRSTIGELPDLVRLAAALEVEEVYVQRLVLTGMGTAVRENSVHGRVDEFRGVFEEAEAVAGQLGVALRASGRRPVLESLTPTAGNPRLGCWRPWRSAVVSAHLVVFPCCLSTFTTPYAELALGDLKRQTWAEIYAGEAYRAVRRGILSGEPAQPCVGCGELWSL